jgi:hypothetical protein
MTEIVWRYLDTGRTAHALRVDEDGALAQSAACGVRPSWFPRRGLWRGAADAAELDRVAGLPRCRLCFRSLAKWVREAATGDG